MDVRLALCFALLAVVPVGCLGTTSDGAAGDCPLTEPRGRVAIEVFQTPQWNGMDIVGTFQRSPDARDAIRCQRRTVGACVVNQCSNVGIDFVNGEPMCSGANPGTLVVTRAGSNTFQVNGSARVTLDRALMSGETLALRTTGGDVPAFTATLTVPARTRVTAPEGLVNGRGVNLARGEDLRVTWEPTTSRVALLVTDAYGLQSTTECVFDGAAGVGTIPANALIERPGHVGVYTLEESSLQVGVFPVTLRVRWFADARAFLAVAE